MKKMNKNILICALLVVMMLFCVSTVSAEDNALDNNLASSDAGDVISAEGDTIYVDSSSTSDDEQGTESSPYKTISSAVGKATGGETIFIKNGNYSESSVVKITKSLSIVGESQDGVSLKYTGDAKGNLIESNTQGISISFANMTFKDSETTAGSGIIRFYGNTPIDVNFTDCTFTNIANKYGALQFANTGTVNIEGCTFSDLTSKSSNGATGVHASAGATFNIKDTVFEDLKYESTGGQNGAVVFMSNAATTLNMDNVTIQRFSGAANSIVRSTGTVNIKKSKFVDNDVQLSSAGRVGDSLFYIGSSGKMTMEQSIIANNTVAKNVFYLGSSAQATINYNNIYNNTFNASYESGFKTNNGVLDAENNYWGSNSLPEGVTANVWVVEEDGSYKLSNGNELEKEIPGLSSEEPAPAAKIIYVSDKNGNNDNDGLSKETAVKTVAKAIELATEGQIVVLEGTYKTGNLGSISDNLTITGEGNVIFDADNNGRILYVGTDANVLLENISRLCEIFVCIIFLFILS